MNAYVYKASYLCGPCAIDIRESTGKYICHHPPTLRKDCTDSDCFPQGPYADGGGEANSPQHCDACGEFLRNPLTQDGYADTERMLLDDHGNPEVEKEWADFYGFDMETKKWK